MNDKMLLCVVFTAPLLPTLNREYKKKNLGKIEEISVPGTNFSFTAYSLYRTYQEKQADSVISVLGLNQERREQK